MTNEEKARQLANYFVSETDNESAACAYHAAIAMAQWKDEQPKKQFCIIRDLLKEWVKEWVVEQLTAFAQHLNKRGAFRDDLCMDFGHEAQSFIELQKFKESMKGNKQ